MKLLLITGMNSTKFGSLEKWIILYAKSLSKNGHELVVHYNTKPVSVTYLDLLKSHNIELHYSQPGRNYLKQLVFFKNLIEKVSPDYVHSFFNSKSIYAAKLAGIEKHRNFWTNPLEMPKKRWTLSLTISMINKISKVFPASEAIRVQMEKAGYSKDNLHTWYFGLPVEFIEEPETIAEPSGNDVFTICSIGHFRDVKGMDLLLRAFAIVKQKFPPARLIQVGIDPSSNPEFSKLATELEIEDSVVWKGIIDDAQNEILNCSVYIQPSRKEAMSFTVMEAAYFQRPVVAFNVGGIPEAVYHNESGYLAPSENVVELAGYINTLLESKGTRERFGKRGKEIVGLKLKSSTIIDEMVTKFITN